MQPAASNSIANGLFHGSERIVLAFAIYGFVAGIVTLIDSMSYEQDIFSILSFPMNYPTIVLTLMLFGENFQVPVPIPVWNIVLVLGTTAIWTTIGFIIYCFYRLFKLGP